MQELLQEECVIYYLLTLLFHLIIYGIKMHFCARYLIKMQNVSKC